MRLPGLLTVAVAFAMVCAFLGFVALMSQVPTGPPPVVEPVTVAKPAKRPAHPPLSSCTLIAEPALYYCKDGYGYIVHPNGRWQNIGPQAPTPGTPSA